VAGDGSRGRRCASTRGGFSVGYSAACLATAIVWARLGAGFEVWGAWVIVGVLALVLGGRRFWKERGDEAPWRSLDPRLTWPAVG
jgi:hypothetical protein